MLFDRIYRFHKYNKRKNSINKRELCNYNKHYLCNL